MHSSDWCRTRCTSRFAVMGQQRYGYAIVFVVVHVDTKVCLARQDAEPAAQAASRILPRRPRAVNGETGGRSAVLEFRTCEWVAGNRGDANGHEAGKIGRIQTASGMKTVQSRFERQETQQRNVSIVKLFLESCDADRPAYRRTIGAAA